MKAAAPLNVVNLTDERDHAVFRCFVWALKIEAKIFGRVKGSDNWAPWRLDDTNGSTVTISVHRFKFMASTIGGSATGNLSIKIATGIDVFEALAVASYDLVRSNRGYFDMRQANEAVHQFRQNKGTLMLKWHLPPSRKGKNANHQ